MHKKYDHPAVTQSFTIPELKEIAEIMNGFAAQRKVEDEFKAVVVDFTRRICKELIPILYSADPLNEVEKQWSQKHLEKAIPSAQVRYLRDCWLNSNSDKKQDRFNKIKKDPYSFVSTYNPREFPTCEYCPQSKMGEKLTARYGVMVLQKAHMLLGPGSPEGGLTWKERNTTWMQSVYNSLAKATSNEDAGVRMSRTKFNKRSMVFTMKNARFNTNFKDGQTKTYNGRHLLENETPQFGKKDQVKLKERFWKHLHSKQEWDEIKQYKEAIVKKDAKDISKQKREFHIQKYNEWLELGERYYFWCGQQDKRQNLSINEIKRTLFSERKSPAPILQHLFEKELDKEKKLSFQQLFEKYLEMVEYHTYSYDKSDLGDKFKEIRWRLMKSMGPYSYKLARTLVEINYYGKGATEAGIGYHGDLERGGIAMHEQKKKGGPDIPGMVVGFNFTPKRGNYRYITFAPYAPHKNSLLLKDKEAKFEEENLEDERIFLEEIVTGKKKDNTGLVYVIKLEGGDAYIMAGSSLGFNHQKSTQLRIKHAAGHPNKTKLPRTYAAQGTSAVATYSAVAESDSSLPQFADESDIIKEHPFSARTLVPKRNGE